MSDTIFNVTERFSSIAPPDCETIERAVALWLTKELSKPTKDA